MKKWNKRRVFINDKETYYQIFSLMQHKDGSIYCSWPDFENTKWFWSTKTIEGSTIQQADSPGVGKLSIHGTGMTGFRKNEGEYDHSVVIHGNKLINEEQGSYGIRHLFTAQIRQPFYVPEESPVNNRKSDFLITTKILCPVVFLFFAIPITNFELGCNLNFDADDIPFIDRRPDHFRGQFIIELDTHLIFALAYRTNHMTWPSQNHIFYDNGYTVPVVIGTGNKEYRADFRQPLFASEGNILFMSI